MARYRKGKRGSVYNKFGVKFTRKEAEEIKRLAKEVNKVREELKKEIPNLDEMYENLGMENPLNIARRSYNLNQFANKGLLEAWKKQVKAIIKNPKKYISRKTKQFQKNYVESILNNYRIFDGESIEETINNLPPSVRDLLYNVLNDSPETFYQKYLNGEYPEISENYIPQEQYEEYLDEVYSFYEGDEDEENINDEIVNKYNSKFKGLN